MVTRLARIVLHAQGIDPILVAIGHVVGNHDRLLAEQYGFARLLVEALGGGLTIHDVRHVVTHHFVAGFGDGLARAFDARLGARVGLLLVFLNLAPGVGTTGGASHRGYGLAGATTDLVAKQTTDHRTNGGTGDLVRVLRLHLILHHLVLAHFARTGTRFSDGLGVEYLAGDIDGLGDFIDLDDLRIIAEQSALVGRHRGTARHNGNNGNNDGFVHGLSLKMRWLCGIDRDAIKSVAS